MKIQSSIQTVTSISALPVIYELFDIVIALKVFENVLQSFLCTIHLQNEADSESETKKPVAELAEADTTFSEEYDDASK